MDTSIIVALISALSVGVISPIVAAKVEAKKHKTERAEAKEDTKTAWQKDVDTRLLADEARLDSIEEALDEQREMNKMLLKGTMLITGHLVDGNHTDALRDYSRCVDEWLINRG